MFALLLLSAVLAQDVPEQNAYVLSDLVISPDSPSENYIFYGSTSHVGASYTLADAGAYTTQVGTYSGCLGDINNDGYDDVWMGDESLYLFLGTPN